MPGTHLQAARIIETCEVLGHRIRERFPEAGLNDVCRHLIQYARTAEQTARQIARPMYGLRLLSALLILALVGAFVALVKLVRLPDRPLQVTELIQVLEAGFSMMLLITATVFFFTSIETRVKRTRALRAIHELRSLAHVIDMHQLTKDPERVMNIGPMTASSPRTNMTRFQLSRYLDYCTEMLALNGKIAALYIDNFADAEAVKAGNDLEELTNGLARKIWQKINILFSADETEWRSSLAAPPQIPSPVVHAEATPVNLV